ncbi:DUF6461 domain-containing protein [Streptomyces sp. T-3]|nr:DUF6461 domain-containing protein [Streptomyces sp. T-3]
MKDTLGPQLYGWAYRFGAELGFCLTLSRGLTADDVMRAYGVDPAEAVVVPVEEAYDVDPDDGRRGTLIRFGDSGGWGFSVECLGIVGGSEPVLSRLSAGTETVTMTYTGGGMTWVSHARDGVRLSSFEPLMPSLVRHGDGPHELAGLIQRVEDEEHGGEWELRRGRGHFPEAIMLDVVQRRFGACPPREVLDGPLPTAFLAEADQLPAPPGPTAPPLAGTTGRKGLGRGLGALVPDHRSRPRAEPRKRPDEAEKPSAPRESAGQRA